MAEFITLLGAEDVRRASSNMTTAAHEMTRAASNIEAALQNHERFLDDWLLRYEAAQTKES